MYALLGKSESSYVQESKTTIYCVVRFSLCGRFAVQAIAKRELGGLVMCTVPNARVGELNPFVLSACTTQFKRTRSDQEGGEGCELYAQHGRI